MQNQNKKIGYILFAISIVIFCFNIFLLIQAKNSLHWPSVMGEIISKQCVQEPAVDPGPPLFVPKVSYKYTVDGKTYYSERLVTYHVDMAGFDCKKMDQELRDKVQVYYNPESPALSVLWPGPRFEHYTSLFIWGVVLAMSVFLWRVNVLQNKKFVEAIKRRKERT